MKRIKLRKDVVAGSEKINSVTVFRMVATSSPNRALSIDEIRRRVRVLDAVDALVPEAAYLVVEDEDANVLKLAVESFPWASASKGLLSILDDVLNPEEMEKPKR